MSRPLGRSQVEAPFSSPRDKPSPDSFLSTQPWRHNGAGSRAPPPHSPFPRYDREHPPARAERGTIRTHIPANPSRACARAPMACATEMTTGIEATVARDATSPRATQMRPGGTNGDPSPGGTRACGPARGNSRGRSRGVRPSGVPSRACAPAREARAAARPDPAFPLAGRGGGKSRGIFCPARPACDGPGRRAGPGPAEARGGRARHVRWLGALPDGHQRPAQRRPRHLRPGYPPPPPRPFPATRHLTRSFLYPSQPNKDPASPGGLQPAPP